MFYLPKTSGVKPSSIFKNRLFSCFDFSCKKNVQKKQKNGPRIAMVSKEHAKSMQKTNKNHTFFHHWTAICLSISTWSTSVNGSKQCSKIYCFFNYNSSFIEHILSGKYVSFCIFTTMYIRKIFIFFTKKHHFQQKNTRFRTTYQAKIRKQHVFLHIFIFARNARKFMRKLHENTFPPVPFTHLFSNNTQFRTWRQNIWCERILLRQTSARSG